MEKKFTPGPWEKSGSWEPGDDTSKLLALCSYHYCYNESGQYSASNITQVCELKAANMLFPLEIEANAKLIAAAPELFEALEKAIKFISYLPNDKQPRGIDNWKEILNKATL